MAPRKNTGVSVRPKAKVAHQAEAAPKTKHTPKKAASSEPKAKPPRRRLLTESPETPSAKRRKVGSKNSQSTQESDKNIPSEDSKRATSTFKISRDLLFDENINENSIEELFQSLDPNSLTRSTWGVYTTTPIKAFKKAKGKGVGKRPTKRNPSEKYWDMVEGLKDPPLEIIPNSPERSDFLRIPLEIRDRIYAYLLTYPSPILVEQDWHTVVANTTISHSIRRVCRQLNDEGTAYLYKHNTIQAIFRPNKRASSLYIESPMINSRYISYYQNVILNFNSECWSHHWFERATDSLQVLLSAKTVIKSLSLVVAPRRVSMSTTALGMEINPITFADFLWYDGSFMKALRELAPQNLEIVIRKGTTKRLTVSVDLRHLGASEKQQRQLINPVIREILLKKEEELRDELMTLKDTFEEIFEDDVLAVAKGKCKTTEIVVEMPKSTTTS